MSTSEGAPATRESTPAGRESATTAGETSIEVLVLALGNPLMGDDGLGAAVLERLAAWRWGSEVVMADGETWGLKLLPLVEEANRLLVIDAIDVGAKPGTLVTLDGAELPRLLERAVSPHQVGLSDVLELARLRGMLPLSLAAIGVQPERVEFGHPLSAVVASAVDSVATAALRQLAAWGYAGREREGS